MTKPLRALPVAAAVVLLAITPLATQAKTVYDDALTTAVAKVTIPGLPADRENNHGWMMFWVNEHFNAADGDTKSETDQLGYAGKNLNRGQIVSAFAHLNKGNPGRASVGKNRTDTNDDSDTADSDQTQDNSGNAGTQTFPHPDGSIGAVSPPEDARYVRWKAPKCHIRHPSNVQVRIVGSQPSCLHRGVTR